MNRRTFMGAAISVPALAQSSAPPAASVPASGARLRTAICAYSFRDALKAGTMKYDDLVHLAVETGLDGIDMTVYWFPSTDDDFLLPLKRLAYRNGVEIYNLGVRVRLCQPTAEERENEVVELIKWLEVAQKMGARQVRVFGGSVPKGATQEQGIAWAAETLKRAADLGAARGIVVALEDDGGITEYAGPTIEIVKRADSPWVGLNLDTGNYRAPKVWDQVEMSLPYATSMHVKTQMRDDNGAMAPADWDKLFAMFARHGYKGYAALEHEAKEDPAIAVPRECRRLRQMARKYSAV